MTGELEKRIKGIKPTDFWFFRKKILEVVAEAKHDLFDYWRRNLIHMGLVEWFGAEDSKPSRVYSELELKKMAYGIPIDTKETSKTE